MGRSASVAANLANCHGLSGFGLGAVSYALSRHLKMKDKDARESIAFARREIEQLRAQYWELWNKIHGLYSHLNVEEKPEPARIVLVPKK